MTEATPTPSIPAWRPVMDLVGTLSVPLSSGKFELILDQEGELYLACKVQDLKGGEPNRFVMHLGETEHDPAKLIEGINMIRNQGASWKDPN